ncbi:hypothetical protein DPMN_134974 [Dreissena polymorpha]|uniref:Uncharacterized protein n=1 Tax=Dreissena polymorpha TaxID=45954 RepID=A0A9D4FX59_DREPO|nr:hypothetical protein DPMN_134974 [Dreissena polymorpha]
MRPCSPHRLTSSVISDETVQSPQAMHVHQVSSQMRPCSPHRLVHQVSSQMRPCSPHRLASSVISDETVQSPQAGIKCHLR